MHNVYEDIEDMLCSELENISKKGELTSNALEIMDKAVDIIKDMKTIRMYDEQYSGDYMGEYSGEYPRYSGEDYEYGRSGRGRRGNVRRDSYGRYRDDISNNMREQLESMKARATSDKEKEMITRWINQLG